LPEFRTVSKPCLRARIGVSDVIIGVVLLCSVNGQSNGYMETRSKLEQVGQSNGRPVTHSEGPDPHTSKPTVRCRATAKVRASRSTQNARRRCHLCGKWARNESFDFWGRCRSAQRSTNSCPRFSIISWYTETLVVEYFEELLAVEVIQSITTEEMWWFVPRRILSAVGPSPLSLLIPHHRRHVDRLQQCGSFELRTFSACLSTHTKRVSKLSYLRE
jgi:hypothetical protein